MKILVMSRFLVIKWVSLDDPETTFMSNLWLDKINLKKAKRLRKKLIERIKELILVAWHLTRWWDWYVPEEEKNGIEPIFIDEK